MVYKQSVHFLISLKILFLSGVFACLSYAEITLDGTVGPKGSLSGPDFIIPSEAGHQIGKNLFHSFGLFNINSSESAIFTGPNSVSKIIGRVTGGSSSIIDGILRSQIPGADLFFINPAGIVFGPNAQLDLQGSFHASTADFIRLGENGLFAATKLDTSVLTVAPPSAFGFLGENPAPISVQGSSLAAPKGETLSFVGGNIDIIESKLSALDGRISLASVVSPSEVYHGLSGNMEIINTDSSDKLGTISVSRGSNINVVGKGDGIYIKGGVFQLEESSINSFSFSSDQGGDVSIDADYVNLKSGANISSSSFLTGNGGNISLNADQVNLEAGAQINSVSSGTGKGGDLIINANNVITITGNGDYTGLIAYCSSTDCQPGTIFIKASDLLISKGNEGIIGGIGTPGGGRSADITIEVKNLQLGKDNSIRSSTLGSSPGGNITITVDESLEIEGTIMTDNFNLTDIASKGGEITINAKNILIKGDDYSEGGIAADTAGKGNAGNIKITVRDSFIMSGNGYVSASSFRKPGQGENSLDIGDAGKISISVPALIMDGNSSIRTLTETKGNAGVIEVNVKDLKLTNGATINSVCGLKPELSDPGEGQPIEIQIVYGEGQPGTITVNSTGSIFISGSNSNSEPSGIFTQDVAKQLYENSMGKIYISTPQLIMEGGEFRSDTGGDRAGGEIKIIANEIILTNGARISSDTGIEEEIFGTPVTFKRTGGGGFIIIESELLSVSGTESTLSTNTLGTGQGGDIQINARQIILNDGGSISARSMSDNVDPLLLKENPEPGKSGTITIHVDDTIRLQNGSNITVETRQSNAGNIKLDAGYLIHLMDESGITTSVAGGEGDGGNIDMASLFLVLDGTSKIIANAKEGRGGNIKIRIFDDGTFFQSSDGIVEASSEFGVSGSVEIDAPDTDISGRILTLPVSYLDASSLLSNRCITRATGELSTFIILGLGGMPLSPDTSFPAFYFLHKENNEPTDLNMNNKKHLRPDQTVDKSTSLSFPPDINCCQ
jgi:filamentous hemagglutinin family protein